MLKLPEVAQRLGVSEKTARRYIKAGTIPSVFIGNAYRVREEDLEEYMRQAQVTPGGVVVPKAEAPLPFDDLDEEILAARRIQAFRFAFPSEEKRVQKLEESADIICGYSDRWRMEVKEVEANGTFPYGRGIEMRTLQESLSDALRKDGISDYAEWVEIGRLDVSSAERKASIRVINGLMDMLTLVGRMREVEYKNREQAGEAAEGLGRLEAEFTPAAMPRKHLDAPGLG